MSETLYLKLERSAKVPNADVTLGDVASLECSNQNVVNKCKTISIYKFHDQTRCVYSVLKIIELIHKEYPSITVDNVGESDFVLELDTKKKPPNWLEYSKVAFICLIIFFGSAFAIMTFNNDVSVHDIFSKIYTDVTGFNAEDFTILELMYSIGLGLGILIFYNHFGKKNITRDPTPIEVEMRKYETEIETTLVDGVNRKEANIDVD